MMIPDILVFCLLSFAAGVFSLWYYQQNKRINDDNRKRDFLEAVKKAIETDYMTRKAIVDLVKEEAQGGAATLWKRGS
jgi:hypothetical protein